ncbi:hypothetical protein [Marinobacter piscensis]|uniref:hypothetical protein n=1 Tax=Marinobacter piscensis TaxID=1562308 RepID=UPI0011AAC770|nr:hypothetical protein [Marinobacter piscensis]
MFKKTSAPSRLVWALPLLVLAFMALSLPASAQSEAEPELKTPDAIKEVEISPGTTSSGAAGAAGKSESGVCERPEQWLYARAYEQGDMAFHGSKVWKAIKDNTGDMPGMNEPPSWELVDGHCAVTGQ